jgi:acetyl esterase
MSQDRAYDDGALAQLAREQDCVEVNGSTVHVRAAVEDLAPGQLDPWLARREGRDRQSGRKSARPSLGLLLALALRPERALVRLRDIAEGVVLSPGEGAADLCRETVRATSEVIQLWRNPVTLWRYERISSDEAPRPAFLHLHGGGWFAGRPTGADQFLRYLADRSGAVVFDLDYSLSPEHKFPHALEEARAVLRHVHDHATTYGIDPARIAVGGGSAGGNLAAATALKARADGGPQMALQVLINPVLVLGGRLPSGLTWRDTDFIVADEARMSVGRIHDPATSRALRGMYRAYIGQADANDPLLSPALAPDLRGLPPAHVFTAEFDILRPQAEHYAGQLSKAGVSVKTVRYRGTKHDTTALFGDVPQPEAIALHLADALARPTSH